MIGFGQMLKPFIEKIVDDVAINLVTNLSDISEEDILFVEKVINDRGALYQKSYHYLTDLLVEKDKSLAPMDLKSVHIERIEELVYQVKLTYQIVNGDLRYSILFDVPMFPPLKRNIANATYWYIEAHQL